MSLINPAYNVQVRRVTPNKPLATNPAANAVADVPNANSYLVTVQGEGENPLQKALTAVRRAVRWVIAGPSVPEFKTRNVYDDPDTRWANQTELKAAQANIQTKSGAEAAALDKLGAKAEGYRALATLCGRDIIARDALLRMLLDGRLAASDKLGKGSLLDHLSRAATQPLTPGLDRAELVTALIEECENPTKIAQEGKGTCVATSSTILLARQNPAEYARLVADLAAPAGKTTTAGGPELTRNKDWNNDNDYGRTPSLRLLQPALMDLGNGFMRYNNGKDVHTLGMATEASIWDRVKAGWQSFRDWLATVPIMPGGLAATGANKILEALTGNDYKMVFQVWRFNRNSAFNRVKAAVDAGKPVPVGLEWEGGGHKVLLDKIEGDKAYITNPWGQRETMSVAEFKSNLMDANLPV